MTSQISLENHYASQGIRQRLDKALQDAGLGSGHIEWSQLVQLDQFHSRGVEAVRELSQVLGAKAEDSVLDLGSGLGGPARFLAASVGCRITGVELTKEYVDISNYLSERTGLADKVNFIQGDAAHLTFADASSAAAKSFSLSEPLLKSGYRGCWKPKHLTRKERENGTEAFPRRGSKK